VIDDIIDVPGIRVGHWTDTVAQTGCTVVLLPADGAVASVDVRGAAPGTRETDLLRPENTVERIHALCLSGGSAFGLAAAHGVMGYLASKGVGFAVGPAIVPIVPAAVVFDLGIVLSGAHPDADAGRHACVDAEPGSLCGNGRFGAGTGATVGKLLGPEQAVPGGIGTASSALPGGGTVGALAVVNAFGNVVAADGSLLAGVEGNPVAPSMGGNTTLAVVATDVRLTKVQAQRLATVAHDGFAHAIRPVHTSYDGDTIFAVSTGTAEQDTLTLEMATVEVVARAIRNAVTA
jgi:L-aminopeptidase/D-esterase-like protein